MMVKPYTYILGCMEKNSCIFGGKLIEVKGKSASTLMLIPPILKVTSVHFRKVEYVSKNIYKKLLRNTNCIAFVIAVFRTLT